MEAMQAFLRERELAVIYREYTIPHVGSQGEMRDVEGWLSDQLRLERKVDQHGEGGTRVKHMRVPPSPCLLFFSSSFGSKRQHGRCRLNGRLRLARG